MTACIRSSRPRLALGLLDEMKGAVSGEGVRPNTIVYNTLLGVCKGVPVRGVGRRNELRRRYGFRKRGRGVVGNGKHGEGVHITNIAEDSAARSASRSDQKSRDRGPAPGLAATSEAGADASRGGHDSGGVDDWGHDPEELMRTAIMLLNEMMEAGGQCAPDKLSFELTMQSCVNASRPEEALRIFRTMKRWVALPRDHHDCKEIRLEAATYRLGLTAASEAGDGAAAAVLLEEMQEAGMAIDEVGI